MFCQSTMWIITSKCPTLKGKLNTIKQSIFLLTMLYKMAHA